MSVLSVEEFATKSGRLHPSVIDFLSEYFDPMDFNLGRVKVNVKLGKTSTTGSSLWVWASTIVVRRGTLNAEFKQWQVEKGDGKKWWKNNGATDLSTPAGMTVLAHECYHVMKWLTAPWWTIGAVLRAMLGKLTGRKWHSSAWEQEAVDFQHGIANSIVRRKAELKMFEDLR